ncbi:MAG: hypothetical protein C0478_01730 [Planctomyces sp.]|nr:hypothetical protein [Planctomyces sp.]
MALDTQALDQVLRDFVFCYQVLEFLPHAQDELLAVKENQPMLRREIEHEFAASEAARPFHEQAPLQLS